ncbi:MAG: hypothetical protein IPG04_19990 [Polyangiaceae bacterium]|jgi:ubiquinone biosynthesis protein COQ4|nr:hypothetical protein [Polyangiaceae bacterium]
MPAPSPLKLVNLARAVVAYTKIVRDPNQLGEVFQLADSLSEPAVMERLTASFRRDPRGRAALVRRARVRVDLARLAALPAGTLGHAYASFMRDNRLTPEALPSLEGASEHEYVRAHLYETHDMWHALTGFGADVAGELGLQGFYSAQVDGPLATAILAAGLLNTALFTFDDRVARMDAITAGWSAGRAAAPLFGLDWEAAWSRPLAEVRQELGIDPAGCAPRRAQPRFVVERGAAGASAAM